MIHLGAALLCDAATVRENVMHILGGGITQLTRPDYPAPLAADVALVLYVDGTPGTEVQHKVKGACYLSDRTDSVFEFEIDLVTQLVDGLGAQSVSIVIPASGFGIPEAGRYEIRLTVDDILLGSIPFSAVRPS